MKKKMKFWLLTRIFDYPIYDTYDAKLMVAPSEAEAREEANRMVGDEGKIWESKSRVACEEVRLENFKEPTEIISDFHAG